MERFNLNILNMAVGKEQYHVEISNRIEALEILDDHVDVNRAWETITGSIKISAWKTITGSIKFSAKTA
jgi:hypothetical protein